MNRPLETVRSNKQSCHFSISDADNYGDALAYAMAAFQAAALEQASPEATPPSPYRGAGSHIEAGFEKVGPDFARNCFPMSNGVGGW
jgi:hypothetical protein